MDVLEELDSIPAFISAINLEPELYIEYYPVKIYIHLHSFKVFKLDNIRHVLGRVSINGCIHIKTSSYDTYIWMYNGYISHAKSMSRSMIYYWVRHHGYYVRISGCSEISEYKLDVYDNNNKLTHVDRYNKKQFISTYYGYYIQTRDGLMQDFEPSDSISYDEIEITANTFYNHQGESMPAGIYKGLLDEDGVPLGYFTIDRDITPIIITTTNKSTIDYKIIDEEPPEIILDIPMIKSSADILKYDYDDIAMVNWQDLKLNTNDYSQWGW